MIRVACADEKAMRTYLGKIEYIKLFWEGAPEGEPAVILYEVDTENERLAHRSIDILQMAAPTTTLTFTTVPSRLRRSPLWRS